MLKTRPLGLTFTKTALRLKGELNITYLIELNAFLLFQSFLYL